MMERDDPMEAMRLMLELRTAGITDINVMRAIEETPRRVFVDDVFADRAYDDVALPIACGQTMSRPVTVAGMVAALDLHPDRPMNVLEVGTGTGYVAAVVSHLCRRVFTVERFRTLVSVATDNLRTLKRTNVEVRHGDGLLGWPEAAPFDRIIVGGSVSDPPPKLLEQLKDGGIMLVPLGEGEDQQVVKVVSHADGRVDWTDIAHSRFLPLIDGVAREL